MAGMASPIGPSLDFGNSRGITTPSSSALTGGLPQTAQMATPQTAQLATPLTNPQQAYTGAVAQNATDYDAIMGQYKKILENANNIQPLSYTPIAPQTAQYNQSPESQNALANLSGLASNGGYSDSAIADIRARGVSPIRSVYASAQRNIDRQRALQGGYSPNYTAATAKLTRDLADSVGNANTNINAGIAQNVAQNRLSIAPTFASATNQVDSARNSVDQANVDRINRANEFNTTMPLQYREANSGAGRLALEATEGMRSLYGTTPALTSTFGNQVLSAAQLQAEQQRIKNSGGLTGLAQTVIGRA